MKRLALLKHLAHDRKAAIYTAAHDGKLRNFVYHESLASAVRRFPDCFRTCKKVR
jgi:hypothetical protein